MQITDDLLQKLEKLAMIRISDDKKEDIKQELGEIVNFVANLNRVPTQDIDVRSVLSTPLRQDIPSLDESVAQSVLKHAPKSEDCYFIVPKIIG
ncbi:Asp-tRNA(Asn)/Glu-tRNA(Gln) amidotransferase GatCAB subunit C [Helicobacter monodelphidis]|uniref:Asp-tRNA(Asn)/Glu-tRNA(Gln) amidotransferase subunit GatC n=1 Tax=Helicobacter sp. 15-1451 TaxID=2004995 RepID=UPI000DCD656A|nr:Asp-tRNA(Asn)/Glu-tRNA(Gln) amidotransferase subunit GatC [Helicobacter sp. 15-1451]RAX58887.1 Asp-tRNA(Asn)/Glu-tRNA(Gln) amidotransferase GatCAB subunit C [Helicobacter sp. 15-1451]